MPPPSSDSFGDRLFGAGSSESPNGEVAREAVASLRGYAYQIAVTAIAWLRLKAESKLYLEIVEDFAEVAEQAVRAVQVKLSESGRKVTLNSESVQASIEHYIELRRLNPGQDVTLHYLTTAEVGLEKDPNDRPCGHAGLRYWRSAAVSADVAPLRDVLNRAATQPAIRRFLDERTDDEIREQLLRNIHWDTASTDLESAILQLEDELINFGRQHFSLAPQDCKSLSATVLFSVLSRAIGKKRELRFLTSADLYRIIEEATRVPVSRAHLAQIMAAAAQTASGVMQPSDLVLSSSAPPWIYRESDTPLARLQIERPELVLKMVQGMQDGPCIVLVGATGLGKSLLAQSVARYQKAKYSIVDFRDLNTLESRQRIDFLAAHASEVEVSLLILDDLNHLNDPPVIRSMARLLLSLRLKNIGVIINCYQRPVQTTVTELGIAAHATFDIPYFTKDEVCSLVEQAGGKKAKWGPVAFIAGGGGHPQLTNAYVSGVSSRGWPNAEVAQFVESGFKSSDVEALRDATRRRLIDELPPASRALLYRLSVVSNTFTRGLAVELGSIKPVIERPGEALDVLIGPWVELPISNRLRVSPLAGNSGVEVLSEEEKKATHFSIARYLLKNRKLNIGDADSVLVHALAADDVHGIMAFVMATLTAGDETRQAIYDYTVVLASLRMDEPIYPANIAVSVMLRMAQFKTLTARPEKNDLNEAAKALMRDIALMPPELRAGNELIGLSLILVVLRAASYVRNWVNLLARYCELLDQPGEIAEHARTNRAFAPEFSSSECFFVSAGLMGLDSVAHLEAIIDELNGISQLVRDRLLADYYRKPGSFDIICSGAWLSEAQRGSLVGSDAALRFGRIAEKCAAWGHPELAAVVVRSQSVMIDEYGGTAEEALKLIDKAEVQYGPRDYLIRSRLKIESRRKNDQLVVDLTKKVSESIHKGEPLERAFTLREAAISAYRQQEWATAAKWFHQAATAARDSDGEPEALAIGLEIDAAVCRFKNTELGIGLQNFVLLLQRLPRIAGDNSLRAIYTRHIIRHAILVVKLDVLHEKGEYSWAPGAGSNMEPSEELRSRPLGPLDFSWYMLAEIDVRLRLGAGIRANLSTYLEKGPIPLLELGLSRDVLGDALEAGDASRYVREMRRYVSLASYLQRNAVPKGRAAFNVFDPDRLEIGLLTSREIKADELAVTFFRNLILHFVIDRALHGVKEFSSLELELVSEFGHDAPRRDLFEAIRGDLVLSDPVEVEQISKLRNVISGDMSPRDVCVTGLRIFEFVHRAEFASSAIPLVGSWLRSQVQNVLSVGTFGLVNPIHSVPKLHAILQRGANDRAFVVSLLQELAQDVGLRLGPSYVSDVLSPN